MNVRFNFKSWTQLGLVLAVASLAMACASAPTSAPSSPLGLQNDKKDLSDKDKAQLLVDIANAALLEGDNVGALQNLIAAEKLDPDSAQLHHSKGLAFFAKKDNKNALIEVQKAVEILPTYSEANVTLGKLLTDAGRYREAEQPLIKAANDPLFRESYKAHTNLGILYYRQGKYEKANPHLDKAIQESPLGACVAYYYRGHLSLMNGKFQSAIQDYDHATQNVCGTFTDAHLALGIAYERSKHYDQARRKFLDIRQNFPNTKVAEQAMDRLKYLP